MSILPILLIPETGCYNSAMEIVDRAFKISSPARSMRDASSRKSSWREKNPKTVSFIRQIGTHTHTHTHTFLRLFLSSFKDAYPFPK
jgi:hypothetical protein